MLHHAHFDVKGGLPTFAADVKSIVFCHGSCRWERDADQTDYLNEKH
jgi:hypothetical protein